MTSSSVGLSGAKQPEFVLCSESPVKAEAYVKALTLAGASEERILALSPGGSVPEPEKLNALAANAKGLLICGGPDIEPERYGEVPRADANLTTMPELDAIEWELLRGARDSETPVLGVCRGMQMLNVFLGGTLHQDVPSELESDLVHDVPDPEDHLAHNVQVSRHDLPFGKLFGSRPFQVNTRHHQAVKRLSPELEEVAHASDGILEVCQSEPGSWWRWAVQWHPENLVAHPLHFEIWRAFVERAIDGASRLTVSLATSRA